MKSKIPGHNGTKDFFNNLPVCDSSNKVCGPIQGEVNNKTSTGQKHEPGLQVRGSGFVHVRGFSAADASPAPENSRNSCELLSISGPKSLAAPNPARAGEGESEVENVDPCRDVSGRVETCQNVSPHVSNPPAAVITDSQLKQPSTTAAINSDIRLGHNLKPLAGGSPGKNHSPQTNPGAT